MSNIPASSSSAATSKLGSNTEFSVTLPTYAGTEVTRLSNAPPAFTATKHRIMVVAKWPDSDAIANMRPLAGAAGSLLFNSLRRYGINAVDCSIAYCSPMWLSEHKNVWRDPLIHEGLHALRDFINAQRPNIILLLGDIPLRAAFTDGSRGVEQWRGSLMLCDDPDSVMFGYKVLPTYDPKNVFIDWTKSPLFFFDMQRLAENASTRDYKPIERDYEIHVSASRACWLLESITDITSAVALDIEGYVTGMSCVSFATSPSRAFILPLATYNDADKAKVLKSLHKFLASSTPKILQNQLYDNFVLSWTYKSPIRNVIWDTMLSGWEIYPELPKGLAMQTSIWTMQPYYKMGRSSNDQQTLHTYCCTDSCVTYEIALRHRSALSAKPDAYAHFKFNMALLPALLYMEQRGIRYNRDAASNALSETCASLTAIQSDLDDSISACWKRYGSRGPAPVSLNVNSPKQVAETLFTRFGYPKQHPKKGREVDTTKVTTNVDALLNLRKTYNGPNDVVLELLLKYRSLDKTRIALEITNDKDGRVRCGYNIVGTDTGRLSCNESPTGSGANLTTITKKLRYLYMADEDHWIFQCDLSGADGWTVAAQCALRGDPTMFDDYEFGLKPAKIIVLMMRNGHEAVAKMDRDTIRKLSKSVDEDTNVDPMGWQYYAAKQVQHGTNYGLGTDKMSDNILKKSYKEKGEMFVVSKQECQQMQDAYLRRYPGVRMWHKAVQQMIQDTGEMPSASGHTRRFFGRRNDHSTYRTAYSHEPQVNTTYATNKALWRLWTDPDNRRGNKFIVEPIHHVHDALIGQFHKSDTEWAIKRIRTWFDNPMTIAGKQITIPFEGAYGRSWGELGADYGGGRI